jgi:glycosyltransferase involved in cell wall biosynthesis
MCAQAAAVSYVSSYRLPNRYPARPGAFTTSYSSIELDPAHFDTKPRTYADDPSQEWSILVAGSLEQPYKGVDILLTALSAVLQHGFRARLTVLGDGKYRPALEQQAENLRISEKVRFLGQIPAGDQVRAQLNCADLFVLPSRTEGLPRAIIEAMARGLPCLGTNVGGIPELIDDDAMVPPDNPDALAEKIIEVLSSPWRMGRMSADNLARAHAYEKDVLQARRDEFYLAVREATYVTTIKT